MSSMHPIRREPHHVDVMDRRWLSNQVFEVTLKRPEGFSFRSMGQWQNRRPPVATEGHGPTGRVR